MTFALTAFERRAAHTAFDTIFPGPSRGSLPLGICDMDLDGFLDETFATVPFESSLGLRLAFLFLAFAPLFFLGKFATLMSLGAEDRERVVERVYDSPYYVVRSTVTALKAVGALLYCGERPMRDIIVGSEPASSAAAPRQPSTSLVVLRTRPTLGADDEARRIA
jgi:hypothetical protein